jgi:Na+/melibiose symporter-like transporter
MTIQEIQSAFDRLSRDNNMRSLSAVLRIGAEQIERRGKLGIFRNAVFATGALALLFTFMAPFASEELKKSLQIWQIIAVVLCVGSLGLLWRVRNQMEQYIEDEQKIRVMMIEASQQIVSAPTFMPTPLSDELRGTLKNAVTHMKIEPSDELTSIIDRH